MKKVLSALLATVVTFSLTGCDNKGRNESPQPTSKPFLSTSESSSDLLPPTEEYSSSEQSADKSTAAEPETNSEQLSPMETSSKTDKAPDKPAETSSENSSSLLASIIRPDVKEAIDSYEEFIDEYCRFMKKYMSSSNPMLMMTEYLDYMQKMSDMSEKFDKLDDSDWTTAETAYYTEIMLRCQNKLLGVL